MEREVQRMTEETLLKIKEAEVDVEGALDRFCGNSALYEKLEMRSRRGTARRC